LIDILLVICVCTAIFSGYKLADALWGYKKSDAVYTSIKNDVKSEERNKCPIDFNTLKEINSDVMGWIKLEDSNIDYPIVYASDNDYYLKHLIDGTENNSGTLFVDARNQHDFLDTNTVIYGHHMRNGSMFADVENYKDSDYYSTHKEIVIETPSAKWIMYPVAGIVTDGFDDYIKFNFASDDEYSQYVNYFVENSTFVSDETINSGDKMMLLSTCSYDVYEGRYVLIGKLVKVSDYE